MRALNETGAWLPEHELQARTVEALDGVARLLVLGLHKGTGKRAPDMGPPMRIEHPDRPGGPKKKKPSLDDLRRMLGRLGGSSR